MEEASSSSSPSSSSSRKKARVGAEPAVLSSLANLQGNSSISFSTTFGGHDVRLFELNEDLIKCIERGETLQIIGPRDTSKGGTTDAVLCSKNKTFTIKKVETSNSVFIVPPSDQNEYIVHSLSQFYYEIKSTSARTEHIVDLLRRTEYNGAAADAEEPVDPTLLLSFDELRNEIQASDEEFASSLFALGVVELQGKMRLLSKSAVREVVRDLIDTVMENGWPIDAVNEQQCLAAMPGTDPVLLNFALKTLGSPKESTADGRSDSVWVLGRDLVCQASAHILFHSQSSSSKPWESDEFMSTWEARTPGSSAPEEALLLNGIALKVEGKKVGKGGTGNGYAFVYLPVDDMKIADIPTRLGQLFNVRPKFLLHELEPYFRDLIGGLGQPKTVSELLMTRTKLVDGHYHQLK